jgi:hypothetical protein
LPDRSGLFSLYPKPGGKDSDRAFFSAGRCPNISAAFVDSDERADEYGNIGFFALRSPPGRAIIPTECEAWKQRVGIPTLCCFMPRELAGKDV